MKENYVQKLIALLGLTVVLVLGRLFSGVHWLTDILAGILLSAALLFVFAAFRPRGPSW